jgi:anti-anti-sigma factor
VPASNLFIHSIRDVTIVDVQEPTMLDAYRLEPLGSDLNELIEVRGEPKLILDLTKVRQAAPGLVTILVKLKQKADENGAQVVLCGLQPEVRRLARIADLDKLLKVYSDEEGALGAFGLTTAGS